MTVLSGDTRCNTSAGFVPQPHTHAITEPNVYPRDEYIS